MAGRQRIQKKSLQEQKESIDAQIKRVQERLNELIAQKDSIEAKIKEEKVDSIFALLDENNLSLDDLTDIIKGHCA